MDTIATPQRLRATQPSAGRPRGDCSDGSDGSARRSRLLLAVLCGLCLSCTPDQPAPAPQPAVVVTPASAAPGPALPTAEAANDRQLFGGSDGRSLILQATTVTLYRLARESASHGVHRDDEVTGDPIVMGDEDARQTRQIVGDPQSYKPVQYACEPNFGVRIRFAGAGGTLDVLLCFGCSEISMYKNGAHVFSTQFDPIKPQLTALMKRLLPHDTLIQSLE